MPDGKVIFGFLLKKRIIAILNQCGLKKDIIGDITKYCY